MATHSSILTWRIPWREEPGGPVQRVAQSWTRLKGLSTQVHVQRENKVKTQAECHLQTTECLRLPESRRETWTTFSVTTLRRNLLANVLILAFRPLEL